MAKSIRESEVKNRIKKEYFANYDWTRVIGDIDLCVCSEPQLGIAPTTYLWAETKNGSKKDIYESFIQLILTIGKARTFEQEMPPYYLGAADAEKIAFVEYNKVMHVFSKTDFNWNVTPSNHETKEFRELYALLHDNLASDVVIWKYAYDDKSIKAFIRKNFKEGRKSTAKIPVNKNNFTFVYYDWVKSVKPSIQFNWEKYTKKGVLDCDFYLADLMSVDDSSLRDSLKVVLEKTKYKILQSIDGDELFQEILFNDGMVAYRQFWNRYQRPPKPVYQKYILDRRDLLVPQDIREVKGSYYTPEKWVRKAQEYLEMVLGENWQEEYYVWDCSAGSGNLLRGLTNKYNIFASTLDDSDIKIMHDAIDDGRLNLVKQNVFQFDFLNDDFTKCPESLQKILNDEEKRKNLVLFNNPPYKEIAGKTVGVNLNNIHDRYADKLAVANRELFAQFLMRMYYEIPSSILAVFSTLKTLQGSNFSGFRHYFQAKLKRLFVVPADTFDNVDGDFPIGFQIWDTKEKEQFQYIEADVFSRNGEYLGQKAIYLPNESEYFSKWVTSFKTSDGLRLGWLDRCTYNDFQNQRLLNIQNDKPINNTQPRGAYIYEQNLIPFSIAFAVRLVIDANWLNDRDQFMIPEDGWQSDFEFQFDCLIYSLFHGQNRITNKRGINHWIPFYEEDVHSPGTFESRFMADFLHGKRKRDSLHYTSDNLFSDSEVDSAAERVPINNLSKEAKAVYEAGKSLWTYYMSKPNINTNASLYDIKAFFQGTKVTSKGKEMMNSDSPDQEYTALLTKLKSALKVLASHIQPKVYYYGFLME